MRGRWKVKRERMKTRERERKKDCRRRGKEEKGGWGRNRSQS